MQLMHVYVQKSTSTTLPSAANSAIWSSISVFSHASIPAISGMSSARANAAAGGGGADVAVGSAAA